LEIRLVSQTFTSLDHDDYTNNSFLCLKLVAAVKQKAENDLLKSAYSKCNKTLRTTLQPHLNKTMQSPANVFKNQYLPREALLAKLTDLRKQNRTLELALKRQEEPEMAMVISPYKDAQFGHFLIL
jgi:hypothetical protein